MSTPFLPIPFLRLSKELYYKPNYRPLIITLDVKPKELDIMGDYFAVLASNADLDKVYIGFNIPPERYVTLAAVAQGVITPFSKIYLNWEDSETGKFVVAVVGQEAAFILGRQGVVLTQDLIGLAREGTLRDIASQVAGLSASDYDIISLDLSVARSDVLVASNVIFLKVLESTTTNAVYSIKLFSTDKPPLTQSILPPGATLERLRRANVYVSNPPQPGSKLELLVFIG